MHMHEIDRSKTHCGSQTSFPELENNDEQMEMKMGEQGKNEMYQYSPFIMRQIRTSGNVKSIPEYWANS